MTFKSISWLFWVHLLCGWRCTAGPTRSTPVIKTSVGSNVTLPCKLSSGTDITKNGFDWTREGDLEVFMYKQGRYSGQPLSGQNQHFVNRVQHFPEQLKHGDASVVIENAKIEDSGMYRCYFFDQKEMHSVRLIVELIYRDRSGELAGAFPPPFVSIRNVSANEAVLWCEVPGASFRPELEWQDSDENQLMAEEPQVELRGDLYYTALAITVTRTSTKAFFCVAKYPQHGHTSSRAWTYAPFCGAFPSPFVSIRNVSLVKAVLWCEVPGASTKPELEWQDSDGKRLTAEEPQVELRGDLYYTALALTVSRTHDKPFFCVSEYPQHGHTSKSYTYAPFFEKLDVQSMILLPVSLGLCGLSVVASALMVFCCRDKETHVLPTSQTESFDDSLPQGKEGEQNQ